MGTESLASEQTSRGLLVLDVDGTLTVREHSLSEHTARLLCALTEAGWEVAVLTGQHIENITPRIFTLLRLVAASHYPCLAIYTCEGANRWVYKDGHPHKDEEIGKTYGFSLAERRTLQTVLDEELTALLDNECIWMQRQPEWWEDAVLVFKVGGELSLRSQLARALESRLNMRFGSPLRVGVAGKTTVIIARADVSKRRVLEDIARGDIKPECIVYMADEFVPPGNDAITLDVTGVVKVSVDQAQDKLPSEVAWVGSGPSAAHRWLKTLLEKSRQTDDSAQDIIRRTIEACSPSLAPYCALEP